MFTPDIDGIATRIVWFLVKDKLLEGYKAHATAPLINSRLVLANTPGLTVSDHLIICSHKSPRGPSGNASW